MLSHRHLALYALATSAYRLRRWVGWQIEDVSRRCRLASRQMEAALPVRIKRHQSRLLRQLGDSEMWLQHNKVTNLGIAIRPLDGLCIAPGETFSFWRRVGRPTRAKGYVEGMEISRGRASAGVGGGICQIANVLHWLVLHSPLVVTERSTHSYDPFPDRERSIPYGTGCSLYYNYIDFRFYNPTAQTFQLRLALTAQFLDGELRASAAPIETYTVFERNHAFVTEGEAVYRQNELWRRVADRRTGTPLGEELIKRNRVRVCYARQISS